MRKNVILGLVILATVTLAFAGCATTIVDKSVPVEQRAILYLRSQDSNDTIHSVDGKKLGFLGMFAGPKGVGGGAFKKQLKPTVQIPPGKHEIEAYARRTLKGSDYYKVTYDFAPGGKYLVSVEAGGDVKKVDNMEDWKKMAKDNAKWELKIEPINGPIPKY